MSIATLIIGLLLGQIVIQNNDIKEIKKENVKKERSVENEKTN